MSLFCDNLCYLFNVIILIELIWLKYLFNIFVLFIWCIELTSSIYFIVYFISYNYVINLIN